MDEYDDSQRGLNGLEETTEFNKIYRLMKTAKRLTTLYLEPCRKYNHYIGKFNKLKNGMAKAYRRINRLGPDYDTFPSED